MPILGIMASAMSGNLFAPSGAYDSIATTTLSTATATITFSSIPATYTHLQIRATTKSANSGTASDVLVISLNGGSNTRNHYLYGNGSVVLAGSQVPGYITNIPQAGSTNVFGTVIVDVLDYANTNKNRTIRSLGGYDNNGGGELILYSNLYDSTIAVTSITISINTGNINQYSSFALYGIKGA